MLYLDHNRLMVCDQNYNCSDRGNCENGVCVCQVQFAGENCTQVNVGYMAAFGSIFSVLALVSIAQLVLCIYTEYKRLKNPTFRSVFRVTTQKLLHGLVIAACMTRVLFFSLQGVIPEEWIPPMESAYHPFLITGLSLVVCYWSEAFFIETASVEASRRAQFLSKSLAAFSVFNVSLYILLIGYFIATGIGCYSGHNHGVWIHGAFQASFAILLFAVYVIFLAIGVEIFFKVKGAFTLSNNEGQSSSSDESVNHREVFKSRLALVFQALLTLLTVLCVVFDAVGNLWKYKVNPSTRSAHEVIYRIAEVGAVLWFPCVLWNTATPEKLWFLNPRCLLQLRSDAAEQLLSTPTTSKKSYNTFQQQEDITMPENKEKITGECWICYDPDNVNGGDFIRPCLCKGGMAVVHHHCLRKWLLQHPNIEESCCKVCKHRYSIEQQRLRFFSLIMKSKRTSMIIPAIIVAVAAPCVCVVLFLLSNPFQTYLKVLVLGSTILLELAAFKVVGLNFTKLYQVTRESALRILNYKTEEISDVQFDYDVIDDTVMSQHEPIVPSTTDTRVLVHVT
ncbi:uncharacterized protein LOC100176980 [Ciona intestinalis]